MNHRQLAPMHVPICVFDREEVAADRHAIALTVASIPIDGFVILHARTQPRHIELLDEVVGEIPNAELDRAIDGRDEVEAHAVGIEIFGAGSSCQDWLSSGKRPSLRGDDNPAFS